MDDSYQRGFGLLIAFVLPGFICLAGISVWVPAVESWMVAQPDATASIGSFLHLTLASVAAGLTVSAVRWALVDTLHHRTGLPYPNFDFSQLAEKLPAYLVSVDFYYRFYQYYANAAVALPVAWISWRVCGRVTGCWSDAAAIVIEAVLLAASRDSLRRYYERVSQLLGTVEKLEH